MIGTGKRLEKVIDALNMSKSKFAESLGRKAQNLRIELIEKDNKELREMLARQSRELILSAGQVGGIVKKNNRNHNGK